MVVFCICNLFKIIYMYICNFNPHTNHSTNQPFSKHLDTILKSETFNTDWTKPNFNGFSKKSTHHSKIQYLFQHNKICTIFIRYFLTNIVTLLLHRISVTDTAKVSTHNNFFPKHITISNETFAFKSTLS